jgi:CRP-like cAMP-binding protein
VQLDPSAFLADSELLEALEERSMPICCDEDRVLFSQGDASVGLYVLSNGEVTLTMDSAHDGPVFSCVATAGSLLGLPGLIGNQPYSLTAIARSGSQVSFIPRDDFNRLMQSELPLMVKILQVLAAEVRSARQAITRI